MSKHGSDYPIILGGGVLKKGMVTAKGEGSGYELFIVWLKKEFERGTAFELSDIEKVQAHIHFCDRGNVEDLIRVLQQMIDWEDEHG